MNEQKFDLCMKIHNILKKKIKGRIFISKNEKQMYVNINPGNNIMYRCSIDDSNIRTLSAYELANSIETDYRTWIHERFFYPYN